MLTIFIHLLFEILAWTSFVWLSWKYIALIGLAHICMLETCNGCILSHYQFKDKEKENTKFYEWCLSKVGIKNYNRKKLFIFMRYYFVVYFIGNFISGCFRNNKAFYLKEDVLV